MAPLLLIAAGLTVDLPREHLEPRLQRPVPARGAALVTGYGPTLVNDLPLWLAMRRSSSSWPAAAGARWTLLPALLKARYGTNEIITTLMMSFIGVDLASILIKGPFQDPTVTHPADPRDRVRQDAAEHPGHADPRRRCSSRSPRSLVVHYVLTRTACGLRLQVLGANPRAAQHFGINLPRLIVVSFLASRLPGRARRGRRHPRPLGLHPRRLEPGLRRHRDPVRLPRAAERARGRAVHRLLLGALDRRRPREPRRRTCSTDFLLVLVALILLFMTVIEYLGRQRRPRRQLPPAGLRPSAASSRSSGGAARDPREPALDAGVLDERRRRRPARRRAADVHRRSARRSPSGPAC